MTEGIGWIVEAEVSGYFDSIDRTCLREVLRKRVNDGSIMRLIGQGLHAGVMEDGVLTHPETGVPQGEWSHPSSPIYSYILSWRNGLQTRCGHG